MLVMVIVLAALFAFVVFSLTISIFAVSLATINVFSLPFQYFLLFIVAVAVVGIASVVVSSGRLVTLSPFMLFWLLFLHSLLCCTMVLLLLRTLTHTYFLNQIKCAFFFIQWLREICLTFLLQQKFLTEPGISVPFSLRKKISSWLYLSANSINVVKWTSS